MSARLGGRGALRRFFAAPLLAVMLIFVSSRVTADETRAQSESIRIAKIKIRIDEREFEWGASGGIEQRGGADASERASIPEADSLRPETVLSFVGIAPGGEMAERELRRRCREAELRLTESGYFYEASVLIAPPRMSLGERTVLVTVTTGFLWRFGGGNAWGMFGKEGLGGDRASLRAYAGWNKTGLSYARYGVHGSRFVLGGKALCLGPGSTGTTGAGTGAEERDLPVEAGATVGFLANPGTLFGVDAVVLADGLSPLTSTLFSAQPFARYRTYLVPDDPARYGTESDLGLDLRLYAYPSIRSAKGESSAFVHGRIAEGIALAVKVAVGSSLGESSFDLANAEDRSVRSGYGADELTAGSFAFASIELRRRIASFTAPPGIGCEAQLFAFADAAAFSISSPRAAETSAADAFGAGARILLDNPVFAYFTFSYGVNHEGLGRFILCATAGF